MRTRNRGQKRSIVSSLGLGPKFTKHKSVVDLKCSGSRRGRTSTLFLRSQPRTRWSSEGTRTRVGVNLGRPRIRKRGSRGLCENSRLHCTVRLESKTCSFSSDPLVHTVYATRTKSKGCDSFTSINNSSTLRSRVSKIKVEDESKFDISKPSNEVESKLNTSNPPGRPFSRGVKRGRPRFSRGLLRSICDTGANSARKSVDFISSETTVQSCFSKKCDPPLHNTSVIDCVYPESTLKPDKPNGGNYTSHDNKSDVKKEDSEIPANLPLPAKRRRGRPPLKLCSALVSKASAPIKSEIKEVIQDEIQESVYLPQDSHHSYPEITEERRFSSIDLVRTSCTASPFQLRFGATDDVLQEVLNEVNEYGFVKLPVKRIRKGRQKPTTPPGKVDENQFVMSFDSLSVERIFDSICKEDKLNDDLASKDLFLAMSGLLRPGVCEVWRRRREDRSKQLSRNLMGRLRPNPRPRRYSDMISQSSHRSHIDGLISLDGIHNNEKTRHQSTRPTTVSAARLTAAKKLIRAKSHVQSSLQITPIRSQSTGYVDELCLDSRAGRSAHRTPKMNVSISSRTSRHPDVSHHIDWKFCYVSSSKQNEVTGLSNSLQRRQRQSSFNSKGRMENVGNFSPIRSLDNSPYNLERDSLEDSCDTHKTDMGNQIQLKPENRAHLQINNPNDVERFNINYNKSIQLSGDRRLERRRKKRRAITFQRKRPNERFLTSHRRDNWYSDKTYLRDDSSASSSTSKSGIVDAYGRSFRQARWYHHRPEIGHSERTGSSYCCHSGLESRSLRKSERSLSSRRIHTSSKFSSRRIVFPEPNHSHASRHRIPRRPDRMCQLTLLDRLVLGLNCSVSQNDDEIHIKQLHAEELNILTQRMSRTGFFIQSLALRQNANNDAEYNIVLTFSSESEAGTRRTRCPNSLFRSKLDSHDRASICRSLSVCDQNVWKKVKSHNRSRRISCLASRHSYLSHSRHISKFHHYKDSSDSSLLVGYQSDSGLLVHRSANYVREFHSDCEESGTLRYKHFEKLSVSRKVSHHVLYSADSKPGHYYPVFGPLDKASLRHLQVNSSGSTKIETHRSCLPPELSYIPSNADVHKRSTILSRISSVKDDEHINVTSQESSTIHISNSSNTNSNNSSHGVSKREANFYIVGAVQNLPFRRHSPRKVIRKVYTGSLTIPKILNRKRIPALPTNPLGGPSVSIPVTSTNSLTSTLVTNSIVSAVSCSTSSSSVGLNSCAPTLLFHDAQSLPIYSSATHLRRLQATVTSLSIVQNPVSTTEQSKISVPPLAVIPSVIADPQTVTKVKIQNSDIAATLHDTLNQPEASASVETTNHGDLPRDHLSGSVAVERVTSENYGEQNVSKANPTDANDPITKTPETEVDVKDFLSDVISSETDIKSVNPVVTSGTDTCPSGSAPYNVVSASSSYTFTAANPFNDEEPILGMDDSQTPATSLSASQLLKLKRLHDEVGRPIQRRDSKSPRCSSHTPSQVQSPIYLPARSQNQSQPLESEAIVTRCPQTSQLQQSQQSIQYTSSVLSNTSGLNSEFRPFPVHLNQDPAHKSNPKLEIDDDDDDDMEDFELKNVTKMYEPSVATSFQSSVPSHKLTSNRFFDNSALSTVPTTISSEPEGLPFMTAHYPTVMRAPRINWPIGRPTFNPTLAGSLRLSSQCFNPLVPATVRCFTEADQNTGSRIVGQGLSTPRASTNDSVGDHFLLSGKPFISSVSPIFSGSGGIPIMTTVQSSTNASVCSGPPKRTVVHKYHSFRKILPKSDRPVMLPTAPGFSISPFSTNTADLGRFSVPSSSFGMYRPGSLGANTVLPCEVTTSRTYIMDIGTPNLADDSSSIPIRRNLCATSLALANSNQSVLATNPASQLLKSLLERDDSRSATGVVTTFAAENNSSFSMSTVVSTSSSTSGSGTPLWNQPAHQSRGTWQLGKRAVSSSNHRSPPDSVSLKISHSVFPTSTSSQPHSSPTSSNPPPILPPTLRLTPGPTSRLQQLQQHYQRQQEAQRRFEQDSLGKLGVADSV